MTINVLKLLNEANTAGIPADSVNSDGDWTFTRPLTKVEEGILADVVAAHDPTPLPPPPTLEEQVAELKAQNTLLIKAVDTSKLTAVEVIALKVVK